MYRRLQVVYGGGAVLIEDKVPVHVDADSALGALSGIRSKCLAKMGRACDFVRL